MRQSALPECTTLLSNGENKGHARRKGNEPQGWVEERGQAGGRGWTLPNLGGCERYGHCGLWPLPVRRGSCGEVTPTAKGFPVKQERPC